MIEREQILNSIYSSRNIIKKDALYFKDGKPVEPHSSDSLTCFCFQRGPLPSPYDYYIDVADVYDKFIKKDKNCNLLYSFIHLIDHDIFYLLTNYKNDDTFYDCIVTENDKQQYNNFDILKLYKTIVPLFIYRILMLNSLVDMRQMFNINENDNIEIMVNKNNSNDIIKTCNWYGYVVISEKTSFYKPDVYKIIEFDLKEIPIYQIDDLDVDDFSENDETENKKEPRTGLLKLFKSSREIAQENEPERKYNYKFLKYTLNDAIEEARLYIQNR